MNSPDISIEKKKFAYWARKIAKYDLSKCSSGNLSHRLGDNTLLISESRSWLSSLKVTQVTLINMTDKAVIEGNKPSGELPLHLAVMKQRDDVKTVLHCQSTAATALACRDFDDIDYNVIIEVPIYIGNIKHVPFIMPGSDALADAVASASREADIIQMKNHGQVVMGNDYDEVLQKAVFFELACNIILNNNFNYISLNSKDIHALRNYR